MPLVQVPKTVSPKQIEIPDEVKEKGKEKPKKVVRSVKGSLHFKPGAVKIISSDEYKIIKEVDKAFADKLQVLNKDIEPETEKKAKKKPVDKPSDDDKDDKKDDNESKKGGKKGDKK